MQTTNNHEPHTMPKSRKHAEPLKPDPTHNVISLSHASNKRQDDLREMHNLYLGAELRRLDQMANLRAEHAKELSALESVRVNAIRQVDVLAVNTAYDRAAAAIQTLAVTTTTNAENLRNALNTTAITIAVQSANTVAAITDRLAALEKSSYESHGRAGLGDPMLRELTSEVKRLREGTATGAGVVRGISASWGVILAIVMGAIAITSLVLKLH